MKSYLRTVWASMKEKKLAQLKAELAEEYVYEARSLDEAKKNLRRILATVKEKKIDHIKEELGL